MRREPGLVGCPQTGCGGYKLLLSERDGCLAGAATEGVGAGGGGKLNMNPPAPGEGAEEDPARLLLGVPYPPEEAE